MEEIMEAIREVRITDRRVQVVQDHMGISLSTARLGSYILPRPKCHTRFVGWSDTSWLIFHRDCSRILIFECKTTRPLFNYHIANFHVLPHSPSVGNLAKIGLMTSQIESRCQRSMQFGQMKISRVCGNIGRTKYYSCMYYVCIPTQQVYVGTRQALLLYMYQMQFWLTPTKS